MRLLFRILTALIMTVVVVIGVLLLLPSEKLAQLVADQVEAQTGRKLVVQGEVALSLWPVLGVSAESVSLSNASWAGDQPMLTANTLSIGVSAMELLRRDVRITSITAETLDLHLATNAKGQGNWVLSTGSAAGSADGQSDDPAQAGSAPPVRIEELLLSNARVTFTEFGAAPVTMQGIDLALSWPEPNGMADLALTLHPAADPVRLAAQIGTFSAFLRGQVSSVVAKVTAPGGIAQFDGRVAIGGEASGRLTVTSEDTARMLRAVGLGEVTLPRGLGQGAVVDSDLTYTPDGRLALRDLSLDLDGNRLQGAVDLVLGEVPHFTAKLQAQDLDLSALGLPGRSDAVAVPKQRAGWSTAKIDASILALANGTMELSLASLDMGAVQLGASTLHLSLERSRAVLNFQPAMVFGGRVQGQLVANNRGGLSVGGKLTYSGLRLEQALGQLAGYDRLNGAALGGLQFLGVGNSQDAIMRSLSGTGRLQIGKGFFTGFDLEKLMRSGGGNGGSTVFDTLTASFIVEGGNLDNQDLLIALKGLRADGQGRIGLGGRDLDYLFAPKVLEANNGQGLSIPLRITGPWKNPKILPDLQQVLETQIEGIEDQASDQLRQRVSEELGVEVAPEQDLQQGLEQRAKDSLLRLLQGD